MRETGEHQNLTIIDHLITRWAVISPLYTEFSAEKRHQWNDDFACRHHDLIIHKAATVDFVEVEWKWIYHCLMNLFLLRKRVNNPQSWANTRNPQLEWNPRKLIHYSPIKMDVPIDQG